MCQDDTSYFSMKKLVLMTGVQSAMMIMVLIVATVSAQAWQLQAASLEERVNKSNIIVLGRITRVIRQEQSLIAGVGECYQAAMQVTRVMKGQVPGAIVVSWCEVVQAEGVRPTKSENIWLLERLTDGSYHVPGTYEGVLRNTFISQVEHLVQAEQRDNGRVW